MKQDIIIITEHNNSKPQTMTSLEIAELTGKQHKNVMQAIRNMEPAWMKTAGLKFQLVEYKDQKGQMRPCHSLTKTECLYIATKFNDEARAKLVLRWEELETHPQPTPLQSPRFPRGRNSGRFTREGFFFASTSLAESCR